jgi:hypothetical protein
MPIMPRKTNKTNSNSYTTKQNTPPPSQIQPPPSIQIQPPSMWDSVKQGFSFGIGSSIAHNIFRSKDENKPINKDVNETINKNETKDVNESKLTTEKMYEAYNKCLEKNDNNIDCTIILQNTSNK